LTCGACPASRWMARRLRDDQPNGACGAQCAGPFFAVCDRAEQDATRRTMPKPPPSPDPTAGMHSTSSPPPATPASPRSKRPATRYASAPSAHRATSTPPAARTTASPNNSPRGQPRSSRLGTSRGPVTGTPQRESHEEDDSHSPRNRSRQANREGVERAPGAHREILELAAHRPDLCTDLCTRRGGTGRDGGDEQARCGPSPGVRGGQRVRRRPGETKRHPSYCS